MFWFLIWMCKHSAVLMTIDYKWDAEYLTYGQSHQKSVRSFSHIFAYTERERDRDWSKKKYDPRKSKTNKNSDLKSLQPKFDLDLFWFGFILLHVLRLVWFGLLCLYTLIFIPSFVLCAVFDSLFFISRNLCHMVPVR